MSVYDCVLWYKVVYEYGLSSWLQKACAVGCWVLYETSINNVSIENNNQVAYIAYGMTYRSM